MVLSNKKELITIFTPTYNRRETLEKCYYSLKNQTVKDFVWLIIDDGSTDNTELMVNSWIKENIIKIRYVYQENQGMHGAHNTAYKLIDTELNTCLDSDDHMPSDAVEKIIKCWRDSGSDKVAGMAGLDVDKEGQIIGTRFPNGIATSTLFDIYHKYRVRGDKKLVYRSELTRQYPYPLFEGEKYVGLNYKYYKIDMDYELLLVNEPLCIVEYRADGSSMNMFRQYRKNPKGWCFYRKENMLLKGTTLGFKFKECIHYVSSSIMCSNKHLFDIPYKFMTICALPFGVAVYLLTICKTRK